ncbi:MAG: hypothetical protein A2729_02260 [Candidatus Buchananbacteria bacterium RIFCSPHIGHO2_01_FULL_39_14]|uniref:tRNA/rRNA methyltransferase SpoU type domain-containing protein n=2 Tax=Candidatus Buchananiibacteriota TaxID=1817903 RepID=A0A1G1YQ08_9BACT|nr:MAG: hypothetical protein A2729_02260 [Candidatus Buchananbacteria bacterium RIFCSPHIGHO2_01_FULL_39_14]OGY48849.1 MAG: hypothetical protein A3D39_00970 [Candidatus Buchananbacteria bacterium RIFCSPHIGHO2_02_FULL_39_17]OGY54369.1 MAG: hypothetical protein A2912_02080 [Candidatus Buchananbacteria bacterium RIFCSPLOWO2_01_FULL_40_23b]
MIKLNSKQLRKSQPLPKAMDQFSRNEIYFILDNVLDTFNIGSIFRIADAVAAREIYLCGETATPPNNKIRRASVNTWQWVAWEYKKTAVDAVKDLRKKIPKIKIIAIEQGENSIPFEKEKYSFPVALIVGHETYGVSQETLNLADSMVDLPMLGVNQSLNVMVSLGIIAYEALKKNFVDLN